MTPRICLNMIVKNESPVIDRCLASVKPWVSHWVIVDTGSSDGTQQKVREAMAGIAGELHERPWRDFAHNRNEALDLARGLADYVLFIDADQRLEMPPDFHWPALSADGYHFHYVDIDWSYWHNGLIATRLPWRWEGVLHEYLTSEQPHQWQKMPGPRIVIRHDGARGRDPSTYLKDIEVLRQALEREPGQPRYTFYLAQSYRDAGLPADAARTYRRRAELGGWDEEVWYSLYQAAVLSEQLQADAAEVQRAYLEAYARRPTRAEPLCQLARFLRLRGANELAHVYALRAATLPAPSDLLFVDHSVYAWRALDELAASAWYAGTSARTDGRQAIDRLLREGKFPESERARLLANHACYA